MLERIEATNGVVFYRSPLLESAGVRHAFTTRIGGVSPRPFDSLNLGNPLASRVKDSQANLEANYQRAQSAIGCEGLQRRSVHQVHGGRVVRVGRDDAQAMQVQADGLLTEDPSVLLSIRTADCVAVLLASEDGRFVAAVHAGWRGVIAGVLPAAVQALRERSRSDLIGAIGPCISVKAFEVGHEVAEHFKDAFGASDAVVVIADGKEHVDLRAALTAQLAKLGIGAAQIDSTPTCTVRDASEFFSHRRDHGVTGRMAALIASRGKL